MKVLILSTHLMGSGHLVRAAALARGVQAAGGAVLLITGGRPIPHADLAGLNALQLPPVASDGLDYKTLLDEGGAPMSDARMAERRSAILSAFDRFRPDAVITELFPFGRRVLAEEFEALLIHAHAASPRPAILCSVRDIPEPPRKKARIAEADAWLARFYDSVLVHGDTDGRAFADAWPASALLASKLRHTGYIADPMPKATPEGPGSGEVLVAVGGGVIGRRLLTVAVEAAKLSDWRWRLLVGGADAKAAVSALKADSNTSKADSISQIAIEPARADYREMIQRAACSVSLCGYNTALDILQSGAPAVLVPMEQAGEQEQLIRARSIAKRPNAILLRERDATPERLAASVETAISAGRAEPVRADGAACAADCIAKEIEKRRADQE